MKQGHAVALYFLMITAAPAADICQKLSESCVDADSYHNVNGTSVHRACWRYESVYQCEDSANPQNTCGELQAAGCSQVGSECVDTESDGSCALYRQSYQCLASGGTTEEQTVCDTGYCTDPTTCFNTTYEADKDFGVSVSVAESMRQAGIYGVDIGEVNFFNGFLSECSVKTAFGGTIKSCCDTKSGGEKYSNSAIRNSLMSAGYAVGKEEVKAGAKWTYDAISELAKDWLNGLSAQGVSVAEGAAESLTTGLADTAAAATVTDAAATGGTDAAATAAEAGSAAAGTQFGAYGFTFSYSAEAGFSFVGFDPWSFVIAIVITIIMDWLSCDADDAMTSMRKGQNLCSYIGTRCDTTTLGTCTKTMEQYCCFNSVLAKLINRQGRVQLGMTLEECGGFNQDQLLQLDLSAMDFQEFIDTLTATALDQGGIESAVTEKAADLLREYYEDDQ